MKNMNQIKVVLPLVLGLSGISYGSTSDGELCFSPSSNVEDSIGDSYAELPLNRENPYWNQDERSFPWAMHPAQQESVPEEERIYLFCDAGYEWIIRKSNRFVFVNGRGDPIFFPEMDLTTFLQNSQCIALPRRLFNRIANHEICSSMKATYGDSEIGGAIRRRINHEKARLSVAMRESWQILTEEGWTNGKPFAMIDENGEVYDLLGRTDMKKAYRKEVTQTLYKKLIHRNFGQKVIDAICWPGRNWLNDFRWAIHGLVGAIKNAIGHKA
jgi:hypothetical protein